SRSAIPSSSKRVRVKAPIIQVFTAIQFSARPVSSGLQARQTGRSGSTALTSPTSSNGTAWTRVLSTTSRRMGRTRNGMDGTGQRYGRRRRVANRTGKPPTPGARRAQALPPPRGEEGLAQGRKRPHEAAERRQGLGTGAIVT